jgi:hypothetical protein
MTGSQVMLTRLTDGFQRWGSAALVAVYALGILGPAVAFAHADAASVIHVLSESHGGFLTLHFHHDDHHDRSKKSGSGPAHHCCGVISVSGLEPGADISLIPLALASTVTWPAEQQVSDCNLDRLDRPPRCSLPL